MLAQLFMANGILLHERFIHKSAIKQNMHYAESQGTIRSWIKWNEPVSPLSGTIAMDIDYDQLSSFLACLLNQSQLMHIGADNVAAPYDNQLSMDQLLRTDATAKTHRVFPTSRTCRVAYPSLKLRGAQPMKEPPIHPLHT
ncbi:hypothetical protein D3C78_840680 [compost metagenome]